MVHDATHVENSEVKVTFCIKKIGKKHNDLDPAI